MFEFDDAVEHLHFVRMKILKRLEQTANPADRAELEDVLRHVLRATDAVNIHRWGRG